MRAQKAEGSEGQVSTCRGVSIKHTHVNLVTGNN